MKTLIGILALFGIAVAQEEKFVLVREGPLKEVPLFYAVKAKTIGTVKENGVESWHTLEVGVLQGKAERIEIGLTGNGEVKEVAGKFVKDWAVRIKPDGSRTLEVATVKTPEGNFPTELHLQVRATSKASGDRVAVLLPAKGNAAAFFLEVSLKAEPGWDWNVLKAEGLSPAEGGKFFANNNDAVMELAVLAAGATARGIELRQAALDGTMAADGGSAAFRLTGVMRAEKIGAETDLLEGAVGLVGAVRGDGWHVELRKRGGKPIYVLVADKAGEAPVALELVAKVISVEGGRAFDLRLPAGVVVPVALTGLAESSVWDAARAVTPRFFEGKWRGFLPVSGVLDAVWRAGTKTADGALFFATTETSDVRAGNGLLRQTSKFGIRVLQGKLGAARFGIDGSGEILSVTGRDVVGWNVEETGGKRFLEVRHARLQEGSLEITVTAQMALTSAPAEVGALRLVPEGALRHSGIVRVRTEGAVRVEVLGAKGLIQLAPEQFPGGKKDEGGFVFRFPTADYGYGVKVEQIMPEVAVAEVTSHSFSESDRLIESMIELDVREAPIREWELLIPADHTVAEVSGAQVADYVAGASEGTVRKLKVLFREPVIHRLLVTVRLEKNEAPKAGAWPLAVLRFPGAKSHRGFVGVCGAAGFRISPGKTAGMVEVPTTFFPNKVANLQAAFRLRETEWSAEMKVEALGRSVQADVFHLYALRSGGVTASVVVNYFVVGAPVSEWRVQVPAGAENLDVTGQNVGRDWRREGDAVIVPLSRPISGAGTLLVTFEQTMNAGGGNISPGEVRPLDVQEERGYVQVVSPLQVNAKSSAEGPVLAVVADELPAEYKMLSSAPTVGAWQYTAREFKIGMDVRWYETAETIGQVVDFAKLESRVARDGQWVTEAVLYVKSLGKTGLRLAFPGHVKVWEMKVAGQPVNPRRDGAEVLVPLPQGGDAKANGGDANAAVEVKFIYGSDAAGRPHLVAPRVPEAPWVMGEWIARGDEGRVLLVRGGSADVVEPMARTGWSSLARHKKAVCLLGLMALVLAACRVTRARGWLAVAGLLAGCVLVLGAAGLALRGGFGGTAETATVLRYAAPVVPEGALVDAELANVPAWGAVFGWLAWFGAIVAIMVCAVGLVKRRRLWTFAGPVLAAIVLLSARLQPGWFWLLVAACGVVALWRVVADALRGRRRMAAATAAVLVCFLSAPTARAASAAESMIHEWNIRDGRLAGVVDFTVAGKQGERFLIVREPAVLTSLTGDGLRVAKGLWEGRQGWVAEMERDGVLTGKATFEMAVADPANGFEVPVGGAAARKARVSWDQPGWAFTCPAAVSVVDRTGEGSGAEIVFGAGDSVALGLKPRPVRAGTAETRFFVETSDLFSVSQGVVNGTHKVTVRPAQGSVEELIAKVPDGFMVSDAKGEAVRDWRYDPVKRELRITLAMPQTAAFSVLVETQRGVGALPWEMKLEPPRVQGAAGTVGTAALWFSDEVQAESVVPAGMGKVNPEDFDLALLPEGGRSALQHVFRYGMAEASLMLKCGEVAPELRSEFRQIVSLGEDRLTVAHDLAVRITRAGVFRLDVEIPAGVDIESVTGQGLDHWVESREGGKRFVTLHLAGKTLGARSFSLVLTAGGVKPVENWVVPKVSLAGAMRETGVVAVVPERGWQVRMVSRAQASPMEPREWEQQAGGKAAAESGALFFRALQKDWALAMAVGKLDAWVTARVLQDVTLREGQAGAVVRVAARIENAAVKSLRVGIPGLDSAAAATVRATGAAVVDLVPVPGAENTWDVVFPRSMAGEVTFDLAYQRRLPDGEELEIQPLALPGVRQVTGFAAIRAGGRLELDIPAVPRGWQKSDWGVARSSLGGVVGLAEPARVFRVSEAEGPLVVRVKRHELAGVGRLRVESGELLSLVSPRGESMTAARFLMRATEKTTLRLKLPAKARLFNVMINGERVPLVKNGEEWMFYVSPSPGGEEPAEVRLVYQAAAGKRIEGPVLDVPMENLRWKVIVPEGWELASHEGDFAREATEDEGGYRMEDYQSFSASKKVVENQAAVKMLDQANEWLAKGDQQRAGLAFNSAVNNGALDAASGEDARVQLRALKTQQAMLGLNTRRQKLEVDNRQSGGAQAKQIEEAVKTNPIYRGERNYDPRQMEAYFTGNSADENAALKEIAGRIVSQQLAVEPALDSLDVTLPERGMRVSFTRTVQAAGRPMGMELGFRRR